MDYEDIRLGTVYSFEKVFSKQDGLNFAELTGDFNKLHIDEEFGNKSKFKQNILHGMLAGSLFSTLVGMHCPGENALYMSQTLNFKLPIFYGDTVTVRGTVVNKNDSIKLITLKTEIIKEGKTAVDGEAKAMVLENE